MASLVVGRRLAGDREGGGLWYVGVGLEVLSTMSGTIGKQLIRLSEISKKRFPRVAKIYFYAGLLINTVLGPVIDMAAYSFAAQSLIAPFGGLDVVWNAALAPYILQEKLSPRRLLGCFLIVVGTGCAGAVGSHEDKEYTIDYIEDTLVSRRVLIYFSIFFVWFLFNVLFLMRFSHGSPVRGVSLGMTAGTIAGNMFCVKASVEIIERSIHKGDGEAWLTYVPYVLLLGAVFFALSNVVFMTRGLQEYEALFMVTVYEGSMIVSGCVSGAAVLLDLKDLTGYRIGLYSMSILIIVVGMIVVFSNELMNKSSLAAGIASIDMLEYHKAQDRLPLDRSPTALRDGARQRSRSGSRQHRPVFAAATTVQGSPCSRSYAAVDPARASEAGRGAAPEEAPQFFPAGGAATAPPPQLGAAPAPDAGGDGEGEDDVGLSLKQPDVVGRQMVGL